MASGGGSSSRKRRDHRVVKIRKNLRKIKKKKINDLNKDPSAAVAASEEMVPHLNIIQSLKCPLTSQPILLQKIIDEKKVKARLEEEVKKLKAQIEKSESVPE
jgi:hypothetical protein